MIVFILFDSIADINRLVSVDMLKVGSHIESYC